jgi:hypothetical protein
MMAKSAAQWPLWPSLPIKYRLTSIQRSTLTAFTFEQCLFVGLTGGATGVMTLG